MNYPMHIKEHWINYGVIKMRMINMPKLLIIDDPLVNKDTQEILIDKQTLDRWFTEILESRKNDERELV
jgi:hypothetical protein